MKPILPILFTENSSKKGLYDDAFPQWRIYTITHLISVNKHFTWMVIMYTALIQKTTDKTCVRKLYRYFIPDIQQTDSVPWKMNMGWVKSHRFAEIRQKFDIPEARKCLEKTLSSGRQRFPYYIQTYYKLLINQLGKDGITEICKTKYDELTAIVDKNISIRPTSNYRHTKMWKWYWMICTPNFCR